MASLSANSHHLPFLPGLLDFICYNRIIALVFWGRNVYFPAAPFYILNAKQP
jgi:hypothetical protein